MIPAFNLAVMKTKLLKEHPFSLLWVHLNLQIIAGISFSALLQYNSVEPPLCPCCKLKPNSVAKNSCGIFLTMCINVNKS